MIIDRYALPYRLDLLLTKRDFKRVQDTFMKCLKDSKDWEEAIRKFQEKTMLPVAVARDGAVEKPNRIEHFFFYLFVDEDTHYGKR